MEKWRGLEMQMCSCALEVNVVSKTWCCELRVSNSFTSSTVSCTLKGIGCRNKIILAILKLHGNNRRFIAVVLLPLADAKHVSSHIIPAWKLPGGFYRQVRCCQYH